MEWDWVETQGKTVEIAVRVALDELGLESAEQAVVEVIEDPQRGFLGIGGRDALVRVKPKPKRRRRRSRRSGRGTGTAARSGSRQAGGGGEKRGERAPERAGARRGGRERSDGRGDGGGAAERAPERAGARRGGRERSGGREEGEGAAGRGRPRAREGSGGNTKDVGRRNGPEANGDVVELVEVEAQADVIREFLVGLLKALGLEGNVDSRVEEQIIYVEVTGEQTEALIGPKGSILQAVLELCRTVVQRRTRRGARIRLDIAGYAERRREALKIYAGRLAEQVLEDGGEAMLEPMNPADRKVVHDAVGEIEGVRSYSEGEEPHRSVVVGLAPGVEPRRRAGEVDAGPVEADAETVAVAVEGTDAAADEPAAGPEEGEDRPAVVAEDADAEEAAPPPSA